MLGTELLEKIEKLAQEVALREGCELYDLEFGGSSGRRTLRVYIDRVDGNVSVEDCSNVSRGLSLALDVEDPIEGAYDLEVSSPGLERVLRKPWHFQRAVGKKIWIRLGQKLETLGVQTKKNASLKQLSAELKSCEADTLEFEMDNENIKIPLNVIEKAKMVFIFDENKGEKKGKKK